MINLKNKEDVRQKGRGPTKNFSYGLRSPNPQDQEIKKFLPHLISRGGGVKQGGKRKLIQFFVCSEVKRKWLRFVFKFYLLREARLDFEIYFEKVFTRQKR